GRGATTRRNSGARGQRTAGSHGGSIHPPAGGRTAGQGAGADSARRRPTTTVLPSSGTRWTAKPAGGPPGGGGRAWAGEAGGGVAERGGERERLLAQVLAVRVDDGQPVRVGRDGEMDA